LPLRSTDADAHGSVIEEIGMHRTLVSVSSDPSPLVDLGTDIAGVVSAGLLDSFIRVGSVGVDTALTDHIVVGRVGGSSSAAISSNVVAIENLLHGQSDSTSSSVALNAVHALNLLSSAEIPAGTALPLVVDPSEAGDGPSELALISAISGEIELRGGVEFELVVSDVFRDILLLIVLLGHQIVMRKFLGRHIHEG